jgi:hypothetical protein
MRDRSERAARKAACNRTAVKIERVKFDPFESARWRVVAGGNPGHVAPPMSKAKTGFRIECRACQREFESVGWAYCPTCKALPIDERRTPLKTGRPCERPDCTRKIPRWRNGREVRKDVWFCSRRCRDAAAKIGHKTAAKLPTYLTRRFTSDQGKETPINGPLLIGPKTMPPLLRKPAQMDCGRLPGSRGRGGQRGPARHFLEDRLQAARPLVRRSRYSRLVAPCAGRRCVMIFSNCIFGIIYGRWGSFDEPRRIP